MARSLTKMELVGAKELEKALRALGSDSTIRRTMRRALKDAAEIVVPRARRRAPKRKGRMAAKIAVSEKLVKSQARHKKRPKKNEAVVYVGAGSGPAHLLEFGTGPRRTKRGKYLGQITPRPFLRPAWEESIKEILDRFGAALWTQIDKSAKRLAKRQAKLIRQGKQ